MKFLNKILLLSVFVIFLGAENQQSLKLSTPVDTISLAIKNHNLSKLKSLFKDTDIIKKHNFLAIAFWELDYGLESGDKHKDDKKKVLSIIKLLIKLGANLYSRVDIDDKGILQKSVELNLYDIIDLVLQKGDIVKLNKISLGGNAIFYVKNRTMLDYLIEKKVGKIDIRDFNGNTVLHKLVKSSSFRCNLKGLEKLVGIENNQHKTPLWILAGHYGYLDDKNIKCIEKLLNLRGDLHDAKSLFNTSLTQELTDLDYPIELYKKVLSKGDDINKVDTFSYENALYSAVKKNRTRLVSLLIKHNANINIIKQNNKNTPLHQAVTNKNIDIVKLLLEAGAKRDIVNSKFKTSFDIAKENSFVEILKLLKKYNAKNSSYSINNKKLIQKYYMAIDSYDIRTIENMLSSKEIDVNIPAKDGTSMIIKLSTVPVDSRNDKYEDVLLTLLKYNPKIKDKEYILGKAIGKNRYKIINFLLNKGIKPKKYSAVFLPFLNNKKVLKKLISSNSKIIYKRAFFGVPNFLEKSKDGMKTFNFYLEYLDPKYIDKNLNSLIHLYMLYALEDNKYANTQLSALVKLGTPIDTRNIYNKTPLMIALKHKAPLKIINYLLDNNVDINAKTKYNYTIAHASAYSSKDIVKLLKSRGMKINTIDIINEETPLILALKKKNFNIAIELIDKKTINQIDYYGKTALNYAQEENATNIIRVLKSNNAIALSKQDREKILSKNKHKIRYIFDAIKQKNYKAFKTFLHKQKEPYYKIAKSICKDGDIKLFKLLLKNTNMPINIKDKDGYTLLHEAVFYNNLPIVKYLINNKINQNYNSNNGQTVFILAANSSIKMLKYLKTVLKPTKNDKDTFILNAIYYKKFDLAQYAINHNFKFNIKEFNKNGRIVEIIKDEEVDTLDFLINKGLDINGKYDYNTISSNNSLMYYAVVFNKIKVVNYLVDKKIDPNSMATNSERVGDLIVSLGDIKLYNKIKKLGFNINKKCNTSVFCNYPLAIALDNNNYTITKALLESGAKVDIRIHNYFTPLHKFAHKGKLDFVKLLVQYGANPYVYDKNDMLPIDLAKEAKHLDIVNYFEKLSKSK